MLAICTKVAIRMACRWAGGQPLSALLAGALALTTGALASGEPAGNVLKGPDDKGSQPAVDAPPAAKASAQAGPAGQAQPDQAPAPPVHSRQESAARKASQATGQPAPLGSPGEAPAVLPGNPGVSHEHRAQVERVRMRLSGSTCQSCLMELERKLRGLNGMVKAKVERAPESYYAYYGGPAAAWAEATLTYDQAKLSFEQLTAFMRTQGYHPYKVVHKAGNQ